ncbi:pyridoxamine 5'-phosphate oxidase family protein [Agreia sp. COWG]|uniref:pyridoxamine 5'-phosphate oxidase family protein n=1 Tax=Agreia sp. COWG TaxID=2773266 RepID=UPI001927AB66|nr:pyridoxamine 5'-phosphate oxidase family protein [Agreia sp. COWG]CAD5995036.1 putative Pyridoxal 5'-phosphate synthase [Agreia sp. COWG]
MIDGVGVGSASRIPAEAFATLTHWLPANDEFARPLIALATVDVQGRPDVRNVLLSEYSPAGFFVHTDERSRKMADVTANPNAAFSIAWPADFRQLTVQATAERATPEEEALAYSRRSRYLQLLAWLNSVEFAELPQPQREAEWAAFDAAHPDGTLTPPPTWAGLLLRPTRITFWRGGALAASTRLEYTLAASGTWRTSILPG